MGPTEASVRVLSHRGRTTIFNKKKKKKKKSKFARKSGDFHVFEMQLVMDFQVSCLIRILCLSRQFRSNYILVMGSLFQDVVIVKITVPGGLEKLVFIITLVNNF